MDPAAYNRLVKTLEASARERPKQLRRGALAFVALGYGYVGAVLIGVLGAGLGIFFLMLEGSSANALGAKAGFALLVLAWIIMRSLWVKLPAPEGIALDLASAPALARRLEEIRAALRAPKPNDVLLTMDFNAAVFQRPRFGVFGWPKTYLQLGVPLLYALDAEQFDAVLAHEFAHLSRAHPKTGLWVFRVSRTWQQLLNQLHQSGSKAGWLFKRFFHWYVPRLEARGFVMSRRDEYEADAEAAQIAGADAMGSALLARIVRGPGTSATIGVRVIGSSRTAARVVPNCSTQIATDRSNPPVHGSSLQRWENSAKTRHRTCAASSRRRRTTRPRNSCSVEPCSPRTILPASSTFVPR